MSRELDDICGSSSPHRLSPYWEPSPTCDSDTAAAVAAFISAVLPEVSVNRARARVRPRRLGQPGFTHLTRCVWVAGFSADDFPGELSRRDGEAGAVHGSGRERPGGGMRLYGSGQLHACVVLACSEEQQWHDRSASPKAAIVVVGVTVVGSLDHAQAPDGKALWAMPMGSA